MSKPKLTEYEVVIARTARVRYETRVRVKAASPWQARQAVDDKLDENPDAYPLQPNLTEDLNWDEDLPSVLGVHIPKRTRKPR